MKRDKRNLEGFVCEFDSHGKDSLYNKYDKTDCMVIGRINETSYNFEDVGTMWEIRLYDGTVTCAFADELKY